MKFTILPVVSIQSSGVKYSHRWYNHRHHPSAELLHRYKLKHLDTFIRQSQHTFLTGRLGREKEESNVTLRLLT